MKKIHDTAQGYSTRDIEVKAYGDPVPAPVLYFHANKTMARTRRGYKEWNARLQEQFKLARADIKAMPNHKLEWRTLDITIMFATQHKVKWGRPRHESRTPVELYSAPVIRALEVAMLWDKSQLGNDVRVRRVYAPASGVMVRIGVTMSPMEFQ